MDELKLILETVERLGGAATTFGYWYLGGKLILGALEWFAFLGLLAYIAHRGFKYWRDTSDANHAIQAIRSTLGIYHYPCLKQDRSDYDESDYATTIAAVATTKERAK